MIDFLLIFFKVSMLLSCFFASTINKSKGELSRLSISIFVDNDFPMRLSFLESKIRKPSHIQKIYLSIDNIKKNILEIYKWRNFQNNTPELNIDSLEKIYKFEIVF